MIGADYFNINVGAKKHIFIENIFFLKITFRGAFLLIILKKTALCPQKISLTCLFIGLKSPTLVSANTSFSVPSQAGELVCKVSEKKKKKGENTQKLQTGKKAEEKRKISFNSQ